MTRIGIVSHCSVILHIIQNVCHREEDLEAKKAKMVNSFSDFAASLSNLRVEVVAYLRRKNKLKSSCTRGYLFFSFLGVSKKISPTELMRAVATTSLFLRKGRRKKMKRHVGCKKDLFLCLYFL